MKNKYYKLLCLAFVALFAACTIEEDDIFGSSSSDRMDAAISSTIDVLTSEENGWLMEYFPGENQPFGGYNVLMKFEKNGTVSISSEVNVTGAADAPTKVSTSMYVVTQSAGAVLSFDTYNDVFHFFADPGDPSGLGGRGEGLQGDYDFQIIEAEPGNVVLKGKKSGELSTLVPFNEDWTNYIADINAAEDLMLFSDLTLTIDDQAIPVEASYRVLTITYEENGGETVKKASYIVTKTGYKLFEPIEILGKTITGFTYHKESDSFTEVNDNNITLNPVIRPFNEVFVDNYWFIAYSKLGEFAQPYFDDCREGLEKTYGEKLSYAYFGYEANSAFGLNFGIEGNLGLMTYKYTNIGDDKIRMKFNLQGNNVGRWYFEQPETGVYRMLIPFGYDTERTFTITVDRPAMPTVLTLTEDGNPTNVITLTTKRVIDPFDN